MPKRSNEFQKLIFLVKQQLAENATVTESKILIDRLTGDEREVDICIETTIAGHSVVVCIECTKRSRRPDENWVEQLIFKHQRLATNVLVLVSHSGFSKQAKALAEKFGVETLSLEDVDESVVQGLLGRLGSLWLKTFELTPIKVVIRVIAANDLPAENVAVFPDNDIYTLNGEFLGSSLDVVGHIMNSEYLIKKIAQAGEESHKSFWIEWRQPSTDSASTLCLKKMEPLTLRPIEYIQIQGSCDLRVSEFPVKHNLLGDVQITWGKGIFFGQESLLVASTDKSGQKRITIAGGDLTITKQPRS